MELLLDTICNVFGGIILMAILVILQTHVTAAVVRSPERDVRARQADFDLARATREVDGLRAELEGLTDRRPDVETAATIAGRKSEFLDAIEAAQRRLERERASTRDVEARLAEIEHETVASDEQVRRLSEEVDAARERLGAVAKTSRQDIRLPMWHDQVAPLQRSIMISRGGVFALPEDCRQSIVGSTGMRYEPIGGRGRTITDERTAQEAASRLMSDRAPRSTYVSFWVTDDTESFEAFQLLRAATTRLGFEYTVMAFEADEGLVLSPGRPKAE